MTKKILITVGGTGGHIYPAMALAKQLKCLDPSIKVMFAGGGLDRNRYFDKESLTHQNVSCGPLSLKKPWISLCSIWRILRGIKQSSSLISSFDPDLVVGFGSYHTLPTLLAAKLNGLPVILHEANRVPGRVNRLLSPYVHLTGVHFPDTALALKGKTLHIPTPLRDGFKLGTFTKEKSREYFGLKSDLLTLLVFGGSQGAKSINQLVADAIIKDKINDMQILHFTGDASATAQLKQIYAQYGISANVQDFEPRMDIAWQASDLVISRSGAGTLTEQLEFEVPGILIPFPHAMDNHQESNADFMVHLVKGAVKYRESELDADRLAGALKGLLANDHELLECMRQAMQDYKHQMRSKDLSSVVLDILHRT